MQAILEGALHKCRPCSDLDKKKLRHAILDEEFNTLFNIFKIKKKKWVGKVDMMNTHPMICGTKGLLEIAERNQIKERSNIRADIFGYCFQKGSILLSRPIICLTRTRISLQKPLRKRHI